MAGSCTLAHPSQAGHAKIASAIMSAYNRGTTAHQAAAKAHFKTKTRFAHLCIAYGKDLCKLLRDPLRESAGLSAAQSTAVAAKLVAGGDADATLQSVASHLGLESASDIDSFVDQLEDKLANGNAGFRRTALGAA